MLLLEDEQVKLKRQKKTSLFLVLGLVAIGTIIFFVNRYNNNSQDRNNSDTNIVLDNNNIVVTSSFSALSKSIEDSTFISTIQLKTFNGIDGNKCFVSLNGVVYEVEDNTFFKFECGNEVVESELINTNRSKLKKVALFIK